MTLPASLIDQVKKGKAILFLGSGALIGADLPGRSILLGDDLRDLLNKQFLDDEFKSDTLAHVAALATSQNSLFTVQDFIGDYLRDLKPAEFHFKIPEFQWRALFTTNYDRLIEACYEGNNERIQDYSIILSNHDKFDETRTTNDKVPLIKLHGCITRTHDESLPLILTVDQYNESLEQRSRLFSHLYELAYENTIIFIGHSLQDHNIRSVLLKLHKEVPQGQRHYLVKPGIKAAESCYWAEQKITSIDCSFKQFLTSLDVEINKTERDLSIVRPITTHPIEKRFVVHSKASDELLRYLTDYAEFVSEHTSVPQHSPNEFYKGAGLGWFPIAEDLNVARSISKRINQTVVKKPEAERKSSAELYVIKGEAGSGKTILLRQIAWESKDLGIGIFLWVKQGLPINIDAIKEICSKTKERVFLIWDDAARNSQEILKCLSRARKYSLPVTILTSERLSEWNTRCHEIDDVVTGVFKLPYLDEQEISDLIEKLDEYDCWGPNIKGKTQEEKKREFKEIYGRQLLVALYEATMGLPFEDIIYDEYSHITPESAKEIYLTVCTLNRMRVPVRAGLISRIHGIGFEEFKEKFYKPLERIVILDDSYHADIHYTARHPEIADIVFKRALNDAIDKYNEYIRILNKLNISYESDRSSFRTMIRAKALHELFPSYEDVKSIYEHALDSIGDDPYLFQQIANFERIRPNGSLTRAIELLEKAKDMAPYDGSIIHSLAVVWRDRASSTEDAAVKIKSRGESRAWLEFSARKWGDNSYISSTLLDLALDDLGDLLAGEDTTDRSIDEAIRRAEKILIETKRKYPSEGHIHSIEARFAELLHDNDRVVKALEASFSESNRDPFIATRLATVYKGVGKLEKAIDTLKSALERRPSDHRLNFQYAELLRTNHESDSKLITYDYRRAYTPKDHNYQAQFWHARFLFESSDETDNQNSSEIFENLRSAHLPFDARTVVRDYIGGEASSTTFHGVMTRKKEAFGFVAVDGSGRDLFCSPQEVKGNLWDAIQEGDRLKFKIGFTFNGPVCCDIDVI